MHSTNKAFYVLLGPQGDFYVVQGDFVVIPGIQGDQGDQGDLHSIVTGYELQSVQVAYRVGYWPGYSPGYRPGY